MYPALLTYLSLHPVDDTHRTINATNPGSDIAGQVAAAMAAASMVFAPKG